MADNTVTIACPVCSTGSTTTTTKTDTDVTTTTTSGTATPPSTLTSPKVEHAIDNIASASSTSIQHTYDLTGYQIPIHVEGFRRLLPVHMPIEVEAIERENQALDALVFPDRAIHVDENLTPTVFSSKPHLL